VSSDIGAIEFGEWHTWHFCWRIGATFFAYVTGSCPDGAAITRPRIATVTLSAATPAALTHIHRDHVFAVMTWLLWC
jgi:hypothetical protein